MSLREPPLVDRVCDQVRQMYEGGVSFMKIGNKLGIPTGMAAAAYHRYYVSRGLPVPPRRGVHQRQAG